MYRVVELKGSEISVLVMSKEYVYTTMCRVERLRGVRGRAGASLSGGLRPCVFVGRGQLPLGVMYLGAFCIS